MTHDDEECLKLGREVVRMVSDLLTAPEDGVAYCRRRFTYPGGEFSMILCRDAELADSFDKAVAEAFEVKAVTPPSQVH